MAGRLKGFRDQLQRLAQGAHTLADELEDVSSKYSRMRAGEWHERSEAAWLALDGAGEHLERLLLLADQSLKRLPDGEPTAQEGPIGS